MVGYEVVLPGMGKDEIPFGLPGGKMPLKRKSENATEILTAKADPGLHSGNC